MKRRDGRVSRSLLLMLVGLLAIPRAGLAQVPNLSETSIEDLMKIEITSASRKAQRAEDVAAAIFVITRDDIRRSGMTSLPDLLRLVPGVEVAQFNASRWAVTVRGFNALYANKLLVLVDGRSVYNQIFSGVFWDAEDVMLDDIDRIEVIRGPGAALWGANAVNGVINILTTSAADTQGGLVRVDAGRAGEQGAVRYGGTLGAASYRLYTQWTRRDQTLATPDTRADDASRSATAGFRVDWTARPDVFMVEGDVTADQSRALWPSLDAGWLRSDTQGGHLVGRWTHTRPGGASLQVQSFVDIAGRQEPLGDYHRRTFDVDTQYHTTFGARQDLVAGAGYRFIDEGLDGRHNVALTPPHNNSSLVTAFLQDEIALSRRLALTLGGQAQHDSNSGAGLQPTARLMWQPRPHQRVWASTSRALRTPSLTDRGIRLEYPPMPSVGGLPLVATVLGNPAQKTETFTDAEAGYRLEIGTTASIDATGFVGRYTNLRTQEPEAPVVTFVPSPRILVTSVFGNQGEATTRGVEVSGHWSPVPVWRLDGSCTAFHIATGLTAPSTDASTPRRQWQVRSAWSPDSRATLDVAIFHVGALEELQISGYTRTDVTAEWRFTSRLSAMVIGQNLFDEAHAEFGGATELLSATQVARTVNARLRWTFR